MATNKTNKELPYLFVKVIKRDNNQNVLTLVLTF